MDHFSNQNQAMLEGDGVIEKTAPRPRSSQDISLDFKQWEWDIQLIKLPKSDQNKWKKY